MFLGSKIRARKELICRRMDRKPVSLPVQIPRLTWVLTFQAVQALDRLWK